MSRRGDSCARRRWRMWRMRDAEGERSGKTRGFVSMVCGGTNEKEKKKWKTWRSEKTKWRESSRTKRRSRRETAVCAIVAGYRSRPSLALYKERLADEAAQNARGCEPSVPARVACKYTRRTDQRGKNEKQPKKPSDANERECSKERGKREWENRRKRPEAYNVYKRIR